MKDESRLLPLPLQRSFKSKFTFSKTEQGSRMQHQAGTETRTTSRDDRYTSRGRYRVVRTSCRPRRASLSTVERTTDLLPRGRIQSRRLVQANGGVVRKRAKSKFMKGGAMKVD